MTNIPFSRRATWVAPILLLAGSALRWGPVSAQSMPQGGQVVQGQATVTQPAGNLTVISQSSDRAVVHWRDFSIAAGNTVRFDQPRQQSATLNVVTGSQASTLAGSLLAKGQVFLVNQNGITISANGLIDARGGFIGSSMGIADSDFMAGRLNFAGSGGAVINRGSILTGPGGTVALIGRLVANEGLIQAPLGKVALGSGEAATLDLSGDGFLQVSVPAGASTADGQALVVNSGTISASGGSVMLRAATVREALRDAVYMPGEIRARSAVGQEGRIVLDGGEGGTVRVSGTLDVSASEANAGSVLLQAGKLVTLSGSVLADGQSQGGRIDISADQVRLEGATVSATGATQGGVVRLGGTFQGGRTVSGDDPLARRFVASVGQLTSLQAAELTTVDAASTINVSATGPQGVGGTAVVWSDQTTQMRGQLLATGAGQGGLVEVSAKSTVQAIDLQKIKLGKGGSLLLDPQDITIDDTAPGDLAGSINFSTQAGSTTHLLSSDIAALLSVGTNVSLQASQDITWNTFFAGPTRTFSQPAADLSLTAGRSISMSGVFTTADGAWSLTANAGAAQGVVNADRGAGFASIDLRNASFINSNGPLSLRLEDGAGNTNNQALSISLGGFNGDSLSAVIAPGASGGFIQPVIGLYANINVARSITLTGNLRNNNGNTVLSGQSVTWTNEATGAVIDGEGALKFVENGVTTRYGQMGTGDAVRVKLGDGTGVTRTYGDADPAYTELPTAQLSLAAHNTSTPNVPLDQVLAAGSLSVTGPGVLAAAGANSLTLSGTNNLAINMGLGTGFFVDVTPVSIPLTIAKRTLTPVLSDATTTYGTAARVLTWSGIANNDVLAPVMAVGSVNGPTEILSSVGVGYGLSERTSAGTKNLTLTGLSGAAASNYTLDLSGANTATVQINPKDVTYFVLGQSQTYGTLASIQFIDGAPTTGRYALTGLLSGDDLQGLVSLSSAGNPVVHTDRLAVGNYTMAVTTLTGTSAGNYQIASSGNTPGTLAVQPKSITYSVAQSTSTYGTLSSTGQALLTGVLSGDDVAPGTVSAYAGNQLVNLTSRTAAGTYAQSISNLSGASASNYTLSSTGNSLGNLVINPLALNYVGVSSSQVYGDGPLPAPSLRGVLQGDSVVSTPSVLGFTALAQAGVSGSGALAAGSYTVGVGLSGASASNYTLAATGNTPGQVNITPKPLTYSSTSANSTYGTEAVLPVPVLTGVLSGDTISTFSTLITANGNVSPRDTTSAGTYTLGVGDSLSTFSGQYVGNYILASSGNAPGTLTVQRKSLTWSVGTGAAMYGDAAPNPVTLNGVLPSDQVIPRVQALDATGTAIALPSVGSYDAGVTALSGTAGGNYTLASVGNFLGSLTVVPKVLSYTIANSQSTYGNVATTGAVSVVGLVGNDAVATQVNVTQAGQNVTLTDRSYVGAYTVDLSSVSGLGSNYTMGPGLAGTHTITPRSISYVVPNLTTEYGADNLQFGQILQGGMSLSGVLQGDQVSTANAKMASGVAVTPTLNAGSYTLLAPDYRGLFGSQAQNYVLTDNGSSVMGSLTVVPRTLSYSTYFQIGDTLTYGAAGTNRASGFDLQARGNFVSGLGLGSTNVSLDVRPQGLTFSTSGYLAAGTYGSTVVGLTGADARNYQLASTGNTLGTLTVVPAPLPVSAELRVGTSNVAITQDLTYGSTAGAVMAVTTGAALASPSNPLLKDNVTVDVVAKRVATGQVVTQLSVANAGEYTIELQPGGLTGSDSANYYVPNIADGLLGRFLINPRPVTLQVGTASSTYGDTPVLNLSLSGKLSGDDLQATYRATDAIHGDVTYQFSAISPSGHYELAATSLTGTSAPNYVISSVASSITDPLGRTANVLAPASSYTIYQRALTGQYSGATSLIYGDATPTVTSISGAVNGDVLTFETKSITQSSPVYAQGQGILSDRDHVPVGTYGLSVALSSADNERNYYLPSLVSYTVSPKTVTYSIPNNTYTYGTDPAYMYLQGPTFTGLVYGQQILGGAQVQLTNAAGEVVSYANRSPAGDYTRRVTDLGSPNYILSATGNTPGSLHIEPITLPISGTQGGSAVYGSSALVGQSGAGSGGGILPGDDVQIVLASTNATSSARNGNLINGTVRHDYYGNLYYDNTLAVVRDPNVVDQTYRYTLGLQGAQAGNYRVPNGSTQVTGSFSVTPKPVLYAVANASGQYGNFKACDSASCYPWTSGVDLGKASFDGVLPGDDLRGVVGVLDLQGKQVTVDVKTPVGNYFQVVTELAGADATNYKVAASGSLPGLLEMKPAWLSYTTSSAVYLGGVGMVGTPGEVVSLRSGGTDGLLNGDSVSAVVGMFDAAGKAASMEKLADGGRYTFPVVELTGPNAGNYRIWPYGSYKDVGTLDVFNDTTLGLSLTAAKELPVVPQNLVLPQDETLFSAISALPDFKFGSTNSRDTSFKRSGTDTGATGDAWIGLKGGGVSGSAEGGTGADISVGDVDLSTQATGMASALASFGVTGVKLQAEVGGHVDVRMDVGPGYVMYGLQANADATLKIGRTGGQLSAEAIIGLYEQVGADGSLGDAGTGNLGVTAGSFAFARADNIYGIKDGKLVVKADEAVGTGVSVGVDGGISGSTGSVDAGVTLYSPGVLGAKGEWSAGFEDGKLSLDLGLGLKIGIGGLDLKIAFTLDANSAYSALGVDKLLGGGGYGLLERREAMESQLSAASVRQQDPAARFAVLSGSTDWINDQAIQSRDNFRANLDFYNAYKGMVDATKDLARRQAEAQTTMLELLKTDPVKAVAFAHEGTLNRLAKEATQLAQNARSQGVQLAVDNGALNYVTITR